MTQFDINIVSDTVCSFCYLGKKRLEKAIAAYNQKYPNENDTFNLMWHPFYLVPDAPKSVDKQEYYNAKFGASRTAMIFQRMAAMGKEEGINFKFGGRTGNTRDSHRLIQLGKKKSPAMQTRVIEELFSMYFENEQDITSEPELVKAGVRAGLDEAEAKEWLSSGKGGPEVDKEVQEAYAKNIHGVPNYTINGKFEVSGAQDPETFLQMFERLKKMDKGAMEVKSPASGLSC